MIKFTFEEPSSFTMNSEADRMLPSVPDFMELATSPLYELPRWVQSFYFEISSRNDEDRIVDWRLTGALNPAQNTWTMVLVPDHGLTADDQVKLHLFLGGSDAGFNVKQEYVGPDDVVPEERPEIWLSWTQPPIGESLLGIIEERLERATAALFASLVKAEHARIFDTASDGITFPFTFPPEIRVAFEQYMVYFAQFLADVGIDAKVDVAHQSALSLITVVPEDKETALKSISEALNAYLDLATEPNALDLMAANPDVAARHLESNVLHLHSQLRLAAATIQMKDATIEQLQLSNYQLRAMLHEIPSIAASEENTESNDAIKVRDIVKLKKFEGKWFDVDLPKMADWLQKLRRR